MASFAAPAASAACCSTAPPTRFTRSIGDCERDPPDREDFFEERFADDFLPADFLPPDDEPLLPDRAVGRLLALFPADPRAVGRFDDDDFLRAPPFLALLPRFAPPRFAAPFLAPPRFAPERLPPLLPRFAPPRDDLALVAIGVYPREGGAGQNRNFRAQAEAYALLITRDVPRNATDRRSTREKPSQDPGNQRGLRLAGPLHRRRRTTRTDGARRDRGE